VYEQRSPTDTLTRILVVAGPGHSRDSLVALLRTIPGAVVAVLDAETRRDPGKGQNPAPDIVVVDLEAYGQAFTKALVSLGGERTGARYLALVDNVRQTGAARALGADYALTRSAPASELLLAVGRLRQNGPQVGAGRPAGSMTMVPVA